MDGRQQTVQNEFVTEIQSRRSEIEYEQKETVQKSANNQTPEKEVRYTSKTSFKELLASPDVDNKKIDKFFSNNIVNAVQEVLNCGGVYSTYAYNKALNYFSIMGEALQIITVAGITESKSRNDAYRLMSISALKKVKGNSYYAEEVKERIIAEKEKSLHYTNDNDKTFNRDIYYA